LATADFDEIWCRDGAYDSEVLSKLYKFKIKGQGQAQQKHILTELSRMTTFVGGNALCRVPF